MKSVGAYEAKTNLPRLLDEVARGEKITITKHGLPVAMLVPARIRNKSSSADAAARIQSRVRWKLPKGMTIKDLIEEGRR